MVYKSALEVSQSPTCLYTSCSSSTTTAPRCPRQNTFAQRSSLHQRSAYKAPHQKPLYKSNFTYLKLLGNRPPQSHGGPSRYQPASVPKRTIVPSK